MADKDYDPYGHSYQTPGIGKIMVDIYARTACNGAVCILPVFIYKDNFQSEMYEFAQVYNSGLSRTAKKYRIVEIYRVVSHSNYFVPILNSMYIWNEVDRLSKEHHLSPRYSRVVWYNPKFMD